MDIAIWCVIGLICVLTGCFSVFQSVAIGMYGRRIEDMFTALILGLVGILIGLIGISLVMKSFGII